MVKRNTSCKKRIVSALIFLVLFALCACLLIPYSRATSAREDTYEVVWQSGAVTRESYAFAYSALSGAENGKLLLEREGLRGEIETSERYKTVRTLLKEGSLPDLLTMSFEGLSSLERAALYKEFCDTCYYSADLFAYDGDRVFRTPRASFSELVLLDGSVSSGVLVGIGATKLILRSGAQLSAASLAGTGVQEIEAAAPYFVNRGGLCLSAPGGTRLVAAVPTAEELRVEGCDFCDEGALSPCKRLASLELPFAGSARSAGGSDYDGRVAWAFGDAVPQTLKRVKIADGTVGQFAFTGLGGVEEIDLCGIPEENISPLAFGSLTGLVRLHTRQNHLSLEGFSRTLLPCGCTLYERSYTG